MQLLDLSSIRQVLLHKEPVEGPIAYKVDGTVVSRPRIWKTRGTVVQFEGVQAIAIWLKSVNLGRLHVEI